MSFRDEPWSQRVTRLGDQAEAVFERVYPHPWVRYGLNRPPINLGRVPAFLRYTPDFLTERGLVEAQGFGTDQTFKLKRDKLDALIEWSYVDEAMSGVFPVHVFVYDSKNAEYAWVNINAFGRSMDTATQAFFPEGKLYYAWHKHQLPVTSEGWRSVSAVVTADPSGPRDTRTRDAT